MYIYLSIYTYVYIYMYIYTHAREPRRRVGGGKVVDAAQDPAHRRRVEHLRHAPPPARACERARRHARAGRCASDARVSDGRRRSTEMRSDG